MAMEPSPIFPAPAAGFEFLQPAVEKEIGKWVLQQIRYDMREAPRGKERPRKLLTYKELVLEMRDVKASRTAPPPGMVADMDYELTPLAELQIAVIDALREFETPERTVRRLGTEIAAREPREVGAVLTPVRLRRLKEIFRRQKEKETATQTGSNL